MQRSTEDPPVDLIVFGGSFDPPHSGHVALARAATARLPRAEICVLPAAAPAMALGDAKSSVADFHHRVAMCRCAFHGERLCVLREEEKLPAPNYTLNTLRHMATLFPGKRLGLLLGADQVAQFARWHEPLAILRLATLIAAPRGDAPLPARDLAGGPLVALAVDPGPAASRTIRAALAAGQPAPAGWLPPGVQSYIHDHHLYAAS